MRVAIIIGDSNSACPVPAVKGGAVATLVEHLVSQNELEHKLDLTVYSYYDASAAEKAKNYRCTKFEWIKIPTFVKLADNIIFWTVQHVFPQKKAISFKSTCSLITYIIHTSKQLSKNNYDVIVLENNIMLSWVLRLWGNGNKYKEKCYYHLHNVPRINARNKGVFQDGMSYICVSNYVANQIMKVSNPIGPIAPSRISVLKNCIDTKKYCQNVPKAELDELRQKFGLKQKDRVLIFAGRLTVEKGIDQVLRALDYIQTPNVKLLVVGATLISGAIKDDFSNTIEELAYKNKRRVVFTGYIAQEDMPKIYRLAEIAVLPSMWDEPAGLTMIEAMACGIPVISTKVGGIPEYTQEGASVLLSRGDDLYHDIAQEIDFLLTNDTTKRQIAYNGQMYIANNNSIVNYLNCFVKIISKNSDV